MLATLVTAPLSGPRWLHEVKFDGYRIEARIDKGRVTLLTRTGLDWTKKFGEAIVEAFKALAVSQALIDGELVVENAAGASDFSALQAALSEGRSDRLVFYAFDLLYLNGYDLRELPLIERKTLLKAVVGEGSGPLRASDHFDEDGEIVLTNACRLGLEGIVSSSGIRRIAPGAERAGPRRNARRGRSSWSLGSFLPPPRATRSARWFSASTTATPCAMSAGWEPASAPRPRARSMRVSS